MPHLWDIVPDGNMLIAMQPEQAAGPLLEVLNSRIDQGQPRPDGIPPSIHLGNFVREFGPQYTRYANAPAAGIMQAVQEAWSWLVREGLVADDGLTNPAGNYFVTRRGRALRNRDAFAAYRAASRLSRELLHPLLQEQVWLSFIRQDWDTAVFQAFREVEIAVREAGGFRPEDIGVPLMRNAFHPDRGPLRDDRDPQAERDALMALFAGAIGSYKNPHSHRRVEIDASDAVEMIMLATHLLRIVDARRPP